MNIKISCPHGQGSESDSHEMMVDCYAADIDGFEEMSEEAQNEALSRACESDSRPIFDVLSGAATGAGLVYVADSYYGAVWRGTNSQFAACRKALPNWATRYASEA